jgi:hypothetical protein
MERTGRLPAQVRRWLSAHGYPPAIPVPVRAADTTDLEALIRNALDLTDSKPEPTEPEPGPA